LRDIAAKQYKALKLSRSLCDLVDAQQLGSHVLALWRTVTESLDNILERCSVNASGQIAFAIEVG